MLPSAHMTHLQRNTADACLGRQVVARLAHLRALNGAAVAPAERRDAELRYLHRVEGAPRC